MELHVNREFAGIMALRETLDAEIQTATDEMRRGEGITEIQLLEHIKTRKNALTCPAPYASA